MSLTNRYNNTYVPSERTARTISTGLLVALILGAIGILAFFAVKLFTGKKEDKSTPSPSPTSGGGGDQPPQPPSPPQPNGGGGDQPPAPPQPNGGGGGQPPVPPQPNGGGANLPLLLYRNGQQITDPNDRCFQCKNKTNPCACYVNNKCSSSKNNFVPPVCNPSQYNCLGYETLNENGGPAICNQNGVNVYSQAANSQRFLDYVCVGRDAATNYNNCITQCEQGTMTGVPPGCTECCKQGCSNMDCSNSTKGGGSGPVRTLAPPPPGNVFSCQECSTLCGLKSDKCEECRANCV